MRDYAIVKAKAGSDVPDRQSQPGQEERRRINPFHAEKQRLDVPRKAKTAATPVIPPVNTITRQGSGTGDAGAADQARAGPEPGAYRALEFA